MGGHVGVVLTSCMFLTNSIQFGLRQSAEAENLMTSVERVLEYGEQDTEADLTNPEGSGRSFSNGIVEYQDVSLKYSKEGKSVLKNVSFKTAKHEKIGIVGTYSELYEKIFNYICMFCRKNWCW